MKPLLLLLNLLASSALAATPAATVVLSLEDARDDDHGPGTYLPPTGSQFRRGDFDLRRFVVRIDGDHAVFEVTLGANLRRQADSLRTDSGPVDLTNGIYVQHVDIYVDTTPGAGFTSGLPGRRIAFAPDEAWDVAISLTPRPGPTRRILDDWDREAARRVITPGPLRSSGTTLTAQVPLAQLGGRPQPTWGWAVTVSGASWEPSFRAVDRIRGKAIPDAFTVPVFGVPEDLAFGGATVDGNHPYVVDLLVPDDRTQAQVLGSYGGNHWATVPMLYTERPRVVAPVSDATSAPPSAGPSSRPGGLILLPSQGTTGGSAPAASAPRAETDAGAGPSERILTIASIQGDVAVIPTPEGGVNAWQIGIALDDAGREVGRVVVTSVAKGFVMVTLTDDHHAIRPGTRVRFVARTAPR